MRTVIVIALILTATPASADKWQNIVGRPAASKPYTVLGNFDAQVRAARKPFTTTTRWPDPRRMCMQFGCDHPL